MDDYILVMNMRCFMYDVLRRFFIEEPSLEYLSYCVTNEIFMKYPFQEQLEEIGIGVDEINRYLLFYNVTDRTEEYEELHWDYTRMFIGPMSLPAPPWASYYLEKDQLLFQNVTCGTKNWYRKFGLGIDKNLSIEAEDHIGFELDFMFHLCRLTIKEFENKRFAGSFEIMRNQKEFIDNHLLRYVPQFSTRILGSAQTAFYKGLAKVLRGTITADSELLGVLIDGEAEVLKCGV